MQAFLYERVCVKIKKGRLIVFFEGGLFNHSHECIHQPVLFGFHQIV
jgi:hypothetical protein